MGTRMEPQLAALLALFAVLSAGCLWFMGWYGIIPMCIMFEGIDWLSRRQGWQGLRSILARPEPPKAGKPGDGVKPAAADAGAEPAEADAGARTAPETKPALEGKGGPEA